MRSSTTWSSRTGRRSYEAWTTSSRSGVKIRFPNRCELFVRAGSFTSSAFSAGVERSTLLLIFMRNIRLQGIFVGSREMAEDMLRAMEAHQIRPVIDRVFDFGEAAEALRYMESGAHFGKIVLRSS